MGWHNRIDVQNDPVNWVDPWGLITKYGKPHYEDGTPVPSSRENFDEWVKKWDDLSRRLDEEYGELWDWMEQEQVDKLNGPLQQETTGCFECTVKCGLKVVGISLVKDEAITFALRKAAKVLAKEWIKKSIPVYNIYSVGDTAYGVADCAVKCYPK